ncbi:S-layer homology domain-containing protein [Candidatus Villigracilis affinis]|uniref:S-layer homology domain-containing protein n=1 Tax=Candidatus Villigracilis affinis TaxID=3140682 RepID=UPI001E0607E2|nr:S-layer homology domain-containing protein [Anaerolineales bacterium]
MRNSSRSAFSLFLVLLILTSFFIGAPVTSVQAAGQTYYVATSGNDGNPGTQDQPWRTIQHAADSVTAGDVVQVRGGIYNEAVFINVSGSAANGHITFQSYTGETAILDGSGFASTAGDIGFLIQDQSYIILNGFEIRNYSTNQAGATPMGIFVTGASHHIQILNNNIHHIETLAGANGNAHGLAVYGSAAPASIHDLLIQGNNLHDLKLGNSEAMVLNGNVEIFTVTNNTVSYSDNIGMDFIGFEGVSPNSAYDQARDGVVSDNVIYAIDTITNPAYGGSQSAAAIYVDGGTRIVIERNQVFMSNIGIEIASEHQGRATSEITVRNNLIYYNHIAGLAMGGYDTQRGSTENSTIVNNTFFGNDSNQDGNGELWIQFDTRNNIIQNNIFFANSQSWLITNPYTQNQNNVVDYNLYFAPAGIDGSEWQWKNTFHQGFAAYQSATGNDAHSIFIDPQLSGTSVSEYRLLSGSPAIDTANCASAPVDDFSGDLRPQGAGCDIGADEYSSSLFADVPSDHWARSWIETLYAAGITSGCGTNPLTFCPDAPVTRAEMAVFLERGMNGAAYNPPAATGTVFTDIPADYWAAAWVEQLFADGITAGCGPDLYCPNDYVTRDQMAIFLLRAKYGSAHTPPPATGVFSDVPTDYWAAAWIEQLAAEGITAGCGNGNYCPSQLVSRAEMAVFLVRTFNLAP